MSDQTKNIAIIVLNLTFIILCLTAIFRWSFEAFAAQQWETLAWLTASLLLLALYAESSRQLIIKLVRKDAPSPPDCPTANSNPKED